MPFRRKILYYGLMLLLTLLVLEGMARIAYYAAYGSGYAGGGRSVPVNSAPLPPRDATKFYEIRHPFYGFANALPEHALNAPRPRQRRKDTVVVGLLGGSVADGLQPFLQRALNRWFDANEPQRQPLVIDLTASGGKQPQQALIVANTLLLGGEFDLIVNLDGFNELTGSIGLNFGDGIFPFLPLWWDNRVGLTGGEILLAGQIGILRREQARLAAAGKISPLRRSALFGLVNRWRQDRTAAEIIRRNHELAATESAYSLEKRGPRIWPETEGAAFAETARLWARGSAMLVRLAELTGAEYYHFLQPNQYAPGAKPLSAEELTRAYAPGSQRERSVAQGYPLLQESCRDLSPQGVPCFDLTGIFADRPETLYIDDCCHLNERGNELLAAEVVRRMEPSLRRLGGESRAEPVSALAAARRPAQRNLPAFQVSLQDDGKGLRYVRADCVAEDTETDFFLHLTPRDWADLPPPRRKHGFDNRSFSFAAAGGRFARGQCALQIRLPEYPIAALRTGQFIPGLGDLWSAELIVPADPEQLRAEYAALAAADPAARDYFDLYDLDNRLIYRRETCAAADTTGRFFMHITPKDPADLPGDQRGFARRDFDFARQDFDFARRGGHFDGKCLATVPLPDYPIEEIWAGQRIPGQDAPLWSVQLIAAPDYNQLRAEYAALAAAEPAARDYFDLYERDNRLIYRRETCAPADTAAGFFLHIIPENPADLPADRRDAGFDHAGFVFARQGGHFDGKCLASVALPEYPIKEMRTGQHIPGQDAPLWSTQLIAAPDYDQLRADYAALSAAEPAARNYFDLYRRDGRLIYFRETCAPADTAAGFFLHIVPENPADLPADRRAAGFVHSGFVFARQGGHFDGKCLAAVALPEYPIKEMRTGQFVPGQGDLWSARLGAAP